MSLETEKRKPMIKIAFCDDDLSVLRELGALMDKYRVERNQDIIYASFNSRLELLTEVERGTEAGYYFSGCADAPQNGISTAREIRKYDTSVKIIYRHLRQSMLWILIR